MMHVSAELYRRFPELLNVSHPTDPDLPYAVMVEFVHWLGKQDPPNGSPELVHRVIAFHDWCMDQPRGTNASNDVFTLVVVSLYEHLIKNENTRAWIKHLVPMDELTENRDYLVAWVGQEAFDLALAAYDTD